MVSSVMQLEVESTGNRLTIRPINIWRSIGDQMGTKTNPDRKKAHLETLLPHETLEAWLLSRA